MRVKDLQEFLSSFTSGNKAGTRQGNAVSDAVIYIEVNGQLNVNYSITNSFIFDSI